MKITKMLITTRFRMRTGSFFARKRYAMTPAMMITGISMLSPMKGMPEKKILRMTLRRILPTLFCL